MPTTDLSHPIDDGMPVYPDTTPVEIERTMTVAEDGVLASVLTLQSHAGTHIDAPAHMRAGAPTLDAFDAADFRFDARRVDCTHLDARDRITVEDLPADETAADVDLLAFATGWDEHWGTDRYHDHPALSPDAATWCAEHDCAVGIDAFSPDPTPPAAAVGDDGEPGDGSGSDGDDWGDGSGSDGDDWGDGGGSDGDDWGDADGTGRDDPTVGDADTDAPDAVEQTQANAGYPAHDALFAADQFIVENLTGLTTLPDSFTLHAYPLPIVGGDASPIRAVAEY